MLGRPGRGARGRAEAELGACPRETCRRRGPRPAGRSAGAGTHGCALPGARRRRRRRWLAWAEAPGATSLPPRLPGTRATPRGLSQPSRPISSPAAPGKWSIGMRLIPVDKEEGGVPTSLLLVAGKDSKVLTSGRTFRPGFKGTTILGLWVLEEALGVAKMSPSLSTHGDDHEDGNTLDSAAAVKELMPAFPTAARAASCGRYHNQESWGENTSLKVEERWRINVTNDNS